MSESEQSPTRRPRWWAPFAALAIALALAWPNFLFTAKWATLPGALNGAKRPWYAIALAAATLLAIWKRREVGRAATLPRLVSGIVVAGGVTTLLSVVLFRLPLSRWNLIPFWDDYTPLFQVASDGVHLLKHGAVVGWNWWFLGGYPTSTDIAQNFAAIAFLPMSIFGDRVGFHLLHLLLYLAVPAFVWWDLRQDDRRQAWLAAGFACLLAAGFSGTVGASGDSNSLVGAMCAGLALVGSRAARLGRRWGGPVLLIGLAGGLYSHVAFFVYAVIFLALEAIYFRDRAAAWRSAVAVAVALVVALPVHWESIRYPQYVSFNNTVYDPRSPMDWSEFPRLVYYNIEILFQPHRWFNDYRSLANIWLPALILVAIQRGRSRAGFYAWAAVVTQLLLRFNTPVAGAMFDRIMHMLPMFVAPALAAFVLRFSGTRALAIALTAVIGLYVQAIFVPIPHVPDLRAWDPPLMDRIQSLDGNLVLVEISPHRDMDSDPVKRSPKTPFPSHFEGLLPSLAGQRFYSQMFDGWVWNSFRGQVVGAGTFRGKAIGETPVTAFVDEMRRWGVRHLMVWTDASRDYLAKSGSFDERWRGGLWSHFELREPDGRSVVTLHGRGELRAPDLFGGDVALTDVVSGDRIVVRTNFYPAWRARNDAVAVPVYDAGGQLAFDAPASGSYVVRLEYPRYRALNIGAAIALILGAVVLGRWPSTRL
jgi:hypothetical protein